MSTLIAANGYARMKNPYEKNADLEVLEMYKDFERENKPLQCYLPSGERYMGTGEVSGRLVWQEHLPFYKDGEWSECDIDGHSPIFNTGAEHREIFLITPEPTVKENLTVENVNWGEVGPELLEVLKEIVDNWGYGSDNKIRNLFNKAKSLIKSV